MGKKYLFFINTVLVSALASFSFISGVTLTARSWFLVVLIFSWNLPVTGVVACYFKTSQLLLELNENQEIHCVSFFGPYFSAFRLNTEIYGLNLSIQSECEKLWTRKIPNTDTFNAVIMSKITQILWHFWQYLSTFQCLENFENSDILWGKIYLVQGNECCLTLESFTSEIWLYSKARRVFVNQHEALDFPRTCYSLFCFALLCCFLIRKDLGQFTSK